MSLQHRRQHKCDVTRAGAQPKVPPLTPVSAWPFPPPRRDQRANRQRDPSPRVALGLGRQGSPRKARRQQYGLRRQPALPRQHVARHRRRRPLGLVSGLNPPRPRRGGHRDGGPRPAEGSAVEGPRQRRRRDLLRRRRRALADRRLRRVRPVRRLIRGRAAAFRRGRSIPNERVLAVVAASPFQPGIGSAQPQAPQRRPPQAQARPPVDLGDADRRPTATGARRPPAQEHLRSQRATTPSRCDCPRSPSPTSRPTPAPCPTATGAPTNCSPGHHHRNGPTPRTFTAAAAELGADRYTIDRSIRGLETPSTASSSTARHPASPTTSARSADGCSPR